MKARGSGEVMAVTFELADQPYAIAVFHVAEIMGLPALQRPPGAPAWVRGVFTWRGRVVTVSDLRRILGLTDFQTEQQGLERLLAARERDHLEWLAALERAVEQGEPFTRARAPDACAFGRWHAGFRTDLRALAEVLDQFEAPHRAFHASADQALARRDEGDLAGARGILESARQGVLATLRQLFARAQDVIRTDQREQLLVLEAPEGVYGLTIDRVSSVEAVTRVGNPLAGTDAAGLLAGTGQGSGGSRDSLILLLDGDALGRFCLGETRPRAA